MRKALSTALPPEVAARLRQGGQDHQPTMRVVPQDAPAKAAKPKADQVRHGGSATRTRGVTADLGELDLGERIRQITTRMPISLADRLDIAVLRQKRTGGSMRSIQAIMIAGAERVLADLEAGDERSRAA